MSIIKIGCDLVYSVNAPTDFIFNILAARTPHQTIISESLTPQPGVHDCRMEEVGEGNRLARLHADTGELHLSYAATVDLRPQLDNPPAIAEVPHRSMPAPVLTYLNPSRYCESDRVLKFACKEFGEVESGYSRVLAICEWTHERLDYESGSTDARSSACDVLLQRAGVCRDYAHVAITLCRALGIPARYVSGYAAGLQPPDFHGFFEAYLDSAWYLFDATRMAPRNGLVRIGTGRDAADAAFATLFGDAVLQQMQVHAQEAGAPAGGQATSDNAAISTA